jgi:hypothetical protein
MRTHAEMGQLCRIFVNLMPFRHVPNAVPEAEPQGNAMKSVRITAVGAVVVIGLVNLTLPARACDDRFIKKCEKAAEAAFAEETAGTPSARRSSRRVKLVALRHSRQVQGSRHRAAPRFAARRSRNAELAERAEPRGTQAESPMARRFRGFISAQPISKNAFETLRKPHAVATDFDAAAILPSRVAAAAESSQAQSTVEAALPDAPAPVATTPKQNKLVSKPVGMELASAESKRVVLPDLPPVRATAAQPVVAQTATNDVIAVAPTQAVTETPSAPQPSSFPIHGLVLAICGALGAAAGLRFIVGT